MAELHGFFDLITKPIGNIHTEAIILNDKFNSMAIYSNPKLIGYEENRIIEKEWDENTPYIYTYGVMTLCSVVLLCFSQNYISWTLFGISLFTYGYFWFHFYLVAKDHSNTNYFLSILFIHDFAIGLITFTSCLLLVICTNFVTPIQVLASNKEDWINSFGHVATYKPIYGMMIFFIPPLTFITGFGAIMSMILYYYCQLLDEAIDRLAITLVIFHLLVDVALATVFKYEFIWNNTVFVSFAIISMIITTLFLLICLYYIIQRGEKEILTLFYKRMYFTLIGVLGLNIVLFIVIMCCYYSLYSPRYPAYSANYDSGYLKNTFNADKYEFVGDLDRMTECPKELIVFNWEDPSNPFGCLKMATYYKGRSHVGLLLDCALSLPFFDLLLLFFFLLEYQDYDYNQTGSKYLKRYRSQERFRVISFIVFALITAGVIIYLIIREPFTKSAPFTKEVVNAISSHNLNYLNQIVPPTSKDLIDQDISYILTGKILFDQAKDIKIILIDKRGAIPQKELQTKTNTDFELNGINAYKKNIPMRYQFKVEMDNVHYDYGDIMVGGLVTGKHINIGDVPLTSNNHKGSIEGKIYEASAFDSAIIEVNVYVVKGYYYPSSTDILSENKELIVSDSLAKAVTDKQGHYLVSNIPQGLYTLIVEKYGYYIELHHFAISNQSQLLLLPPIYLTNIFYPNTIGIALEWANGPRDLDLFVSFELNNKGTCMVGYMNKQCGGVSMTCTNDKGGNKGIEMITINQVSNYTYTVYVHKYNSNSEEFIDTHYVTGFINEGDQITVEDLKLTESKAKVKLYLPEYKFALLNDQVPIEGEGNYWKVLSLTPHKENEFVTVYDEIATKYQ